MQKNLSQIVVERQVIGVLRGVLSRSLDEKRAWKGMNEV